MWKKRTGKNEIKDSYDDDDKSYRRLKIAAIVLAAIAVILGISFVIGINLAGTSTAKNIAINKETTEAENNNTEETSEEANSSEETTEADNGYNVEDLYYEVHLRANTIILAEDDEIWEEIAIDKDFLNTTIPLLKGKDDYLYNELLKWKDLDFSNAVEVHNYVWEKLGGTVGKASAINEQAVQELKEKLAQ